MQAPSNSSVTFECSTAAACCYKSKMIDGIRAKFKQRNLTVRAAPCPTYYLRATVVPVAAERKPKSIAQVAWVSQVCYKNTS